MGRNSSSPLGGLVGSVIVVAVLMTLMFGAWWVWIPVVAALAVMASIWNGLRR